MPLRIAAAALLVLLFALPTAATAQAKDGPPQLVSVTERLPWYDRSGVNFSYSIQGSYPFLQGRATYAGVASLQVLGIAPNSTLLIRSSSSSTNTLFPNGTSYDDPIFPSYVQVLPVSMVVPGSFDVLAPTYGLSFKYLGNATVRFDGSKDLAYTYSVKAVTTGQQEQSAISKYYQVLPSNGVILSEGVTDSITESTFNMTLSSLSQPLGSNLNNFTITSPDFAAPGNYVVYKSLGSENETIKFQSIIAEPDRLFLYEKQISANGSKLGDEFFVDQYSNPFFYPASTELGNTISFPVAVGSLEIGQLDLKGETSVKTLDGSFQAYSYANQTIGFEAYLESATGVAVYLELPGGFLQLSASNFLVPEPVQTGSGLVLDLVPVALVAALIVLVYLHYRKPAKRRRR